MRDCNIRSLILSTSIIVECFKVAQAVIGVVALLMFTYVYHCTWVTSEAYSSPSIVLSAHSGDGGNIIFDDFREAYYWLRQNTHEVSFPSSIVMLSNLE